MELGPFVASSRPAAGLSRAAFWRRVAGTTVALTVLSGTFGAAAHRIGSSDPTAVVEPVAAAEVPPAPEPPVVTAPAAPTSGPGYRIVRADGGVFTHGWYGFAGSGAGATTSATVGIAQTPDGEGYWLATADGGVFAFGTAPFHGSAAGATTQTVVDVTATPSGDGYWVTARDGGVFAFGDAGYYGSGPEISLPGRVATLASTPSGRGYWLAGTDGGVFAFGDAGYFGSLGDQRVNARIVDLVPTPSGEGYWLVGADGGVFTFGDAAFHGAALDERLSAPIVDMERNADGSGYWLLAADGGVFSYGEAPFLGAPVAEPKSRPFAAIVGGIGRQAPPAAPAPAPAPAPPETAPPAPPASPASTPASVPGPSAVAPTPPADPPVAEASKRVAVPLPSKGAVRASSARAAAAAKAPEKALDGEFGWDISYPQCGRPYPDGKFTYGVVGITGGRAFRYNRCLADEWRWARSAAAGAYVNVNFPRTADELAAGATSDRQPDCGEGALGCVAYNFGLNGVRDALTYARAQGVDVPFVWLDVEQLNHWTPNQALNAVVLRGAIDAVRDAGLDVGIYSTPYQFRKIMGDEQPQVPVWTAGAPDLASIATYCATKGFGGGPAVLVQLLPGQFDANVACPGAGAVSRYFRS